MQPVPVPVPVSVPGPGARQTASAHCSVPECQSRRVEQILLASLYSVLIGSSPMIRGGDETSITIQNCCAGLNEMSSEACEWSRMSWEESVPDPASGWKLDVV